MDEGRDVETEGSPYIRLPWPLVATGLAGVIVVALAAGLFANRYLRPQVTLVPKPVPIVAAAPSPTGPAATSTRATIPTATSLLVTNEPVATAAPTAAPPAAAVEHTITIAPTQASEPVPTMPPVAVTPTQTPPISASSQGELAASASPRVAPVPTVEPALAAEVGKAYEQFWRTQSQALLDLDTTRLDEVMDGDYLATIEQRIEALRAENRALKIHVSLSYSVVDVSADLATIIDDIIDNSVYVRIDTEDPLTTPAADQLRIRYQLQNYSGVWKVVSSVTYE